MKAEGRYRSDDLDLHQSDNDLLVFYGENGDCWERTVVLPSKSRLRLTAPSYISIVKHGEKIGPAVRITTSGAPRGQEGVAKAVANLFLAMKKE